MVARMLNICGLYLGDEGDLSMSSKLNPAMNPSGYWEHAAIRDLMDRMFDALDGTWENPPILAPGWELEPEILPFYEEARLLLEHIFEGHAEWAWKLPKASVTLAFWKKVVPNLRFIICVRNPLDFASSLGQYTSVSRSHLYAMWQYYNYYVLCHTEPNERFLTNYESYFPDYLPELTSLLNFCGLDTPLPGSAEAAKIDAFMDVDLKHYNSHFEDVIMDKRVPYTAKELYTQLLASPRANGDLDLLRYRELLLPLLENSVVAEGSLDSTNVVPRAEYDKLKAKYGSLRSKYDIVTAIGRRIRKAVSKSKE